MFDVIHKFTLLEIDRGLRKCPTLCLAALRPTFAVTTQRLCELSNDAADATILKNQFPAAEAKNQIVSKSVERHLFSRSKDGAPLLPLLCAVARYLSKTSFLV
jgi:hypothetical protein